MTQAFTARQRIRHRPEFQRVYDRGFKVHGRFMTLFVLPNTLDVSRLGLAATRKLGGAVQRNLAKRRMREVFRTVPLPPGLDVVVVPRRELLDASHAMVEAEYRAALQRRERSHGAGRSRGRS